ncbi:hypothetical protein SCWH03_06690 [Streptomyces pacificus]|uniref:Uncharacterized protein n=1 Tax=Streptomyces pacificus TaxID=2705029 RepID=A0A6A0APP2_9ACTN|nr:hypothetical protein SCWH03_06690 [Streptomyces pacificus]
MSGPWQGGDCAAVGDASARAADGTVARVPAGPGVASGPTARRLLDAGTGPVALAAARAGVRVGWRVTGRSRPGARPATRPQRRARAAGAAEAGGDGVAAAHGSRAEEVHLWALMLYSE